MSEITKRTIQSVGREVRGESDEIKGNCQQIAHTMQSLIDSRFDIPLDVIEVHVGFFRDTHFVNKLAGEDFAEDVDGDVLIDAALDQFCVANVTYPEPEAMLGLREEIPSVAIYTPGDVERHIWYYNPKDTREGHDVFSGEPFPE